MENNENSSEATLEKPQDLFTPSQELVDFADTISSKFISLNPTTYYSDNKNYRINIVMKAELNPDNKPLFRIARVGQKSGRIELEKHYFLQKNNYFSKNFMFYLIIWCACEKNVLNQIETELLTFQYYERTGRPVQDVLDGYKWMVSLMPNTTLKNRFSLVERLATSEKTA